MRTILHRIQAHLRASIPADGPRIGPFVVNYAADTANMFRNYAIPDDAAQPTAGAVAALVAWFHAHERSPRLEYVSPAGGVEAALLAAGFTVERRLPLMVLDTLHTPPTPDATTVLLATTGAELRDCARVQNAAYDGDPGPSDADLARLTSLVDRGGAVALAVVDGEPASSGLLTAPRDDLAEVAAVGTLAHLRRRGLAATVVGQLCRYAQDHGVTPYLQAESEREAALYARLGFIRVGALALVNGPATVG